MYVKQEAVFSLRGAVPDLFRADELMGKGGALPAVSMILVQECMAERSASIQNLKAILFSDES